VEVYSCKLHDCTYKYESSFSSI